MVNNQVLHYEMLTAIFAKIRLPYNEASRIS